MSDLQGKLDQRRSYFKNLLDPNTSGQDVTLMLRQTAEKPAYEIYLAH